MKEETEEDSFFVQFLGGSSFIRVLDYLISNDAYDCSIQDIAEGTELARNTISRVLAEMETRGIAKHVRNIGMAKMYQLNRNDTFVKRLIQLDLSLSRDHANRVVEEIRGTRKSQMLVH